MSANKRPSTSSLRRFITSRPYVTVAELRRRFGLDDPDAMAHVQRNGTSAWIGLPEREATKLQELWHRDELGLEMSVEVQAPVVVGVYPMRIARYVVEANGAGDRPAAAGSPRRVRMAFRYSAHRTRAGATGTSPHPTPRNRRSAAPNVSSTPADARQVAIVARDLIVATRIADAAEAAGLSARPGRRTRTPAVLIGGRRCLCRLGRPGAGLGSDASSAGRLRRGAAHLASCCSGRIPTSKRTTTPERAAWDR